MAWAVFKQTFKDSIRITLIWGFGLAAMMVLMVLMVPMMTGIDLVEIFEDIPPAMMAAFGLGDDIEALATPEGLIAFGFFGKMALIFAAFPVVMRTARRSAGSRKPTAAPSSSTTSTTWSSPRR